MKVLNIGSMNLDHVYNVEHIILPGETQATTGLNLFLGGKGMNQSIALAKAGVEVYHGGMIGKDGYAFIDACKEYGVHFDYIREAEGNTGHTIIQIDKCLFRSLFVITISYCHLITNKTQLPRYPKWHHFHKTICNYLNRSWSRFSYWRYIFFVLINLMY